MLQTDILPPRQREENITVLLCVLFAMNPAIFSSCWEELWQPFIYMCILERTCILLGLLCLVWTLMVTKVIDIAVHCGLRFWLFPVRATLYSIRAWPRQIVVAGFAKVLKVGDRSSPHTKPTVSGDGEPRTRKLSKVKKKTAEQERAEQHARWMKLQQPWGKNEANGLLGEQQRSDHG